MLQDHEFQKQVLARLDAIGQFMGITYRSKVKDALGDIERGESPVSAAAETHSVASLEALAATLHDLNIAQFVAYLSALARNMEEARGASNTTVVLNECVMRIEAEWNTIEHLRGVAKGPLVTQLGIDTDEAMAQSMADCTPSDLQALSEVHPAAIVRVLLRKMLRDNALQGHSEPCYYCKVECNELAGNPSEWPIPLCHEDEPGVVKWHHTGCVSERLRVHAELIKT